jgi:hypothetical protein
MWILEIRTELPNFEERHGAMNDQNYATRLERKIYGNFVLKYVSAIQYYQKKIYSLISFTNIILNFLKW